MTMTAAEQAAQPGACDLMLFAHLPSRLAREQLQYFVPRFIVRSEDRAFCSSVFYFCTLYRALSIYLSIYLYSACGSYYTR